MRLTIIGTGYVGLVTGACLADAGNDVWCVDKNVGKVEKLRQGHIPIYEPGLEEVVKRNEEEGRLRYTTSLKDALDQSEICFICVDTPVGDEGRADITNVIRAAQEIGKNMASHQIVVTKSTVPIGTTIKVKETISEELRARSLNTNDYLDVASNPEFLKEGSAVNDFMKPNRIIVGVEKDCVAEILHALYAPFMRKRDRFLKMDIASSELAKYAANAMLATRISFVNELARLCERVGADIAHIREALGTDPRIGPDFLYAGLGYGGSCLPKDMKALVQLGKEYHTPLSIADTADRTNDTQREWFWDKISIHFDSYGGIEGKRVAVWGVAFKANTDDVRYAPSIALMKRLSDAGAKVMAFDPVAMDSGRAELGNKVTWCKSNYDCLSGADALIVCTEWHEFRSPDFGRMRNLMRTPAIFDGRNLYNPDMLREFGFKYNGVGRPRNE